MGDPGYIGHLGFHHRLGEGAHALTQEVDVAIGDRLADRADQNVGRKI